MTLKEKLISYVRQLIDKITAYKIENSELTASNEALQSEKASLEVENSALETRVEQLIEKAQDAEQLEVIIDASGVLESTDGTATEKVERLIHATDLLCKLYRVSYYGVHSIERFDFYIDWADYVDFSYARNLKFVLGVDTNKVLSCRDMFFNCSGLVTIQIPFNMSKHNAYHMDRMFSGCSALVDVSFVKETIKESIIIPSPVLSKESIKSIIDGLADLTGGTMQKLTFHSSVLQRILEDNELFERFDDATLNKNWSIE